MSLTYGIDEAGRGPILGPMVVAVVAVSEEQAAVLAALGVMDSKRLGSGAKGHVRRHALLTAMRPHLTRWSYKRIYPDRIDRYTMQGLLNRLEQEAATDLLRQMEAPADATIIADGANVFGLLQQSYPNLRAVNNGEAAHVAVAAASIIAKVIRDDEMEGIVLKYTGDYGPITGGGYLNAGTRRFLDAYKARNGGKLPPEARASWGAKKS